MMREMLAELCELLRQQKAVLEDMLKLSEEERQIIIDGNSEKLEEIIRQELKTLSKLGQIEKKRTALHKGIAEEFKVPEAELTVTAIAERADPDESEIIVKLQKELTDIIRRHTEINNENRQLIEAQLEYSETMLDLLVEPDDPLNNFYGGDGRTAEERKKTTGLFNGHA